MKSGRRRLGRGTLEPIQLSRGELELTHQHTQRGMDMRSGSPRAITSERPPKSLPRAASSRAQSPDIAFRVK